MAAQSSHQARLAARIESRSVTVGVVGLGYVGLPLAMAFCDAGITVVGFDINDITIGRLQRGESHIIDVASSQVAKHVRAGRFRPTSDEKLLEGADCLSIAVPTSLTPARKPDLSHVRAAVATAARRARPGMLVVLESTTYPGTTRELLVPALEKRGLIVGRDVFVAFSPERVDPRNGRWNTENTPRLVGGVTPACTALATSLYATCVRTVVPVSTPETAELAKLLENTFRLVNIGLANEMAGICDRIGVDVWEVIDAAATKPFGFMKFEPGPGVGGHCIPVDPLYLAWKMKKLRCATKFIDLASAVSASMPGVVVDRVARAVRQHARKGLRGSRVLVLGVAYKRDMDDLRESPALEVIRLLDKAGARTTFHDPHVSSFRQGRRLRTGVPLTDEVLASADVVVVVTDHSAIDWLQVTSKASLIVDTRNALGQFGPTTARIVGLTPRASTMLADPAGRRAPRSRPRRKQPNK